MIRLNLQKEPYWLPIFNGVRFKVRPLETPIIAAARARAQRIMAELTEQAEQAREAGIATPDQLALLDDADLRKGRLELMYGKALACYAITEWEGIGNETGDAPAPVTEENIGKLMTVPSVWETFVDRYTRSLSEALAEGNASGPGLNGTSAPGRATAKGAARKTSRARKGNRA